MKKAVLLLSIAATLLTAPNVNAVPVLTTMTSFSGDGWFAPGEGGYSYLGTGGLERGIAYNPATGNVLLVSRFGGTVNVRRISGTTGADLGSPFVVTGVTGGGGGAANMIGVTSDGAIYMGNLATSANTFRLYRWSSEATATTTAPLASGALTHASLARLGDSLDVIGTGSATTIVTSGSGVSGYGTLTFNGTSFSTVNQVTPITGTTAGDFRLGITFANSANEVYGKQTAANLRESTYSGATGTLNATGTLTSSQEAPMDFTLINNVPYLATIDVGTSLVRVYDMTNPGTPVLVVSKNNTSGSLTANTNGTGQVKWGALTDNGNGTLTQTLYAMSSNQGIQALNFTVDAVPEASSFLAVGMFGLLGFAVTKRKGAKRAAA